MDGIRALARWRVAPSSSGAGIVDQSGVSMALFIINLPGCGWLPRNAAHVSCLRRDFKLRYYSYSVQLGYSLTGCQGRAALSVTIGSLFAFVDNSCAR